MTSKKEKDTDRPQRYRGVTRRLAQALFDLGPGGHHLPRRALMDELGIYAESSLRASLILLEDCGAISWERNDTRKGRSVTAFAQLDEEKRKELADQHRVKSGIVTVVINDSEMLESIASTGYQYL
jgi:hypothetical protein